MAVKKLRGKVFVGMSGGVDSSVSAALLQEAGFDVTGVFMKVWQPDFLPCTWREEKLDAMRVSATLGIPLLTWDFEKEYKEGVADYMIREYRQGRTPNPDVMCNREVKFGAFFRRAMKEGADFVATGHYARIALVESGKLKVKSGDSIFRMLKGVDDAKDQSYFLWTLNQPQLSKTFFPIGGYKKSQVRALAKKFELPVAEKKDSQGLCFMGKLDVKDFLAHFIEEKEGNVVNEKGEIIGTHRGAHFYTLGERHGFTVTKKTADDTPFYIIAKDLGANTITVAHQGRNPLQCASRDIKVSQANFCKGTLPDIEKNYTAQVRYHGEQYKCRITDINGTSFVLKLDKKAVFDRGQSMVLYDGNECLGGGIIE
ncbi:MAG: tRNA 2-thiouridine(34) synthase MnmA [Candidatus Yonathbacteria bacterium]|nr:tRNA 2-thiouridine(34) synthase MnmA [Candidatus Yonathbacteria bacterium]